MTQSPQAAADKYQATLDRRTDMLDNGAATRREDGSVVATTGWDAGEVIGKDGIAQDQNGKFMAAYARRPAWHSFGWVKPGDEPMTVTEALRESGLGGWNVQKRPLFWGATDESKMGTGKAHNVFATVRTDIAGDEAYLGTVGHRYTIFQTEQVMGFLDELLGQGGQLGIEAAIALDGGRKVAISCFLPENIILDPAGRADMIKPYIQTVNSFDGSGSMYSIVTPLRGECANTVRWGKGLATAKWSTRHTTNGLQRTEEARRQMGMTVAYYKAFKRDAEEMIHIPYTDAQFDRFLEEWYPLEDDAGKAKTTRVEKKRDLARGLYRESPTNARVRGTLWGAAQALIEQDDWYSDVRAPKSVSEDVVRAGRILDGAGVDKGTDRKSQLRERLLATVR